ncbi:MAG: magnesium transporter [Candidatus Nanoarchaeia archaeon]
MSKNEVKQGHKALEKHLITKIPTVRQGSTVKDVLSMMERLSRTYDSVDYIYVVDNKDRLVGTFSIKELFNNPKNTPIRSLMQKGVISVSPDFELERIADLALKHNLKQIPVVKSKKLLGVVSSRKILSTLNRSLKEDILHFAGIHKSHLDFENSLEIPLSTAIKNRLYWLVIGFFGAMFMALYIGLFEETLAKYLIVASFVPAIVYMSDALGTQVQTVFVRDLAILGKDLNFKNYLFRQMRIAFFIALIIGVFLFSFIFLLWKVKVIAFAISLASFITLIVASFTALLITLLIKRFKFDPALGSGPVATIISDVTSVVIYFVVVALLL